MNLKSTTDLNGHTLDGWIVTYLEDEYEGPGVAVDQQLDGVVKAAMESREFTGKSDKTLLICTLGKIPVPRVVAVGLGKRAQVNAARLHRSYAVGARALRDAGCTRIGALLPPDFGGDATRIGQSIAEGVLMGLYDYDKYKSSDEPPKRVEECWLQAPAAEVDTYQRGLDRGRTIGEAANFAREIANEVPSVASPAHVAGLAGSLSGSRVTVEVLDEVALAQRGMNAILAVGRGSANPPRMVRLEYRGAAADAPTYAVVGKGITFDSGGLSLKSAVGMEDMKFDKCGACAVLGIVKGAAELALPINLVGVIALAENMPGGTAYKPGDIIRAGSGKTIEVLNTDAEGRVVLADALWLAGQARPAAMVDLATLTGAVVIALGDIASGIMGNDESLIRRLIAAGESTGERAWELPLWPEYDEKVKSDVADVKNLGERSGGSSVAGTIAGASFLKTFVPEGCPWAHLDIAGTASDGKKRAYRGPGATGVGVRLILEWLSGLGEGS